MKKGNYGKRIGTVTPVFVAGIMEYTTKEILFLAAKMAGAEKKRRISPSHILKAIRNDEELNQAFGKATIVHAGYVPDTSIHMLSRPTAA